MTVRGVLISWTIGFVLLIVAFVATLAMLNGTLYSAHGFVASYLDALNRHDATAAREMPGVRAPDNAATNLLTDDTLGSIANIQLVRDSAGSHGVHTVTYSYDLGKRHERTAFRVLHTGSFLGLFDRWSFATSPLATVSVTVLHDPEFRANGTDVVSTSRKMAASPYVVFAPGLYTFDRKSTYLIASPVAAAVSEPGSVTPVQVDVQANATFIADVKAELHKYLAACATQKVLMPTSCPFGKAFNNRVVSTPSWAMVTDPPITIVPDGTTGNWLVPDSTAVAHLKVQVQSLYDGKITTYDEDVPFPVSFSIRIDAGNHLTITSLDG
jgi:hypothetical protein